jgi:hypothetical protein
MGRLQGGDLLEVSLWMVAMGVLMWRRAVTTRVTTRDRALEAD